MRFKEITGHTAAKALLRELADSGKVPHALLLSGAPGIGKMRLARAFAQYLHCTDRRDGDSCGKCPTCRQHEALNCPDLSFSFPVIGKEKRKTCELFMDEWTEFLTKHPYMEPEAWNEILNSENGQPIIYVDEAEETLRKMALSTYGTDLKIRIIWLPEKMHASAANKLLKLIEEPSEDTQFILVSNNPQELLPTIYSRTQRIALQPLSEEEVAGLLVGEYRTTDEEADEIARISGGRVSTAIELASSRSERREFAQLFATMMRTAYARKPEELKRDALKLADLKREKSKRFFTYAAQMIRENFIYNLNNPALNVQLREEREFSSRFARFINAGNVEEILNEISRAERDITRNANGKLVCFDLLLRIAMLIR